MYKFQGNWKAEDVIFNLKNKIKKYLDASRRVEWSNAFRHMALGESMVLYLPHLTQCCRLLRPTPSRGLHRKGDNIPNKSLEKGRHPDI